MKFFSHTLMLAVPLLATVGVIAPAQASSDKAWAEFNARVTKSCAAAAVARGHVRNLRPSTIVGFDDRAGKVAMLLSDRTHGSAMSWLCLYDKRTRVAYIDEAEMWSAPPQTR